MIPTLAIARSNISIKSNTLMVRRMCIPGLGNHM